MSRSILFLCAVGVVVAGCPSAEPAEDGGTDSGVVVPVDAGANIDAGVVDAGTFDAGAVDAGLEDAGVTDAGVVDAGVADAGVIDAGVTDAGVIDAGVSDAGTFDVCAFFFPAERINGGLPDGGSIRHVLAADMDQDGHLDLVVSGSQRSILFGDGDGGFPTELVLPSFGVAAMLVVTDVNADGRPDIVMSNSNLSQRPFTLSTNLGARQFATAGGPPIGSPTSVLAPMAVRDGGVDFVFQSHSFDGLLHRTVLPDAGWVTLGGFIEPAAVTGGGPNFAATDFDGDGQRDLVLLRPASQNTQMVYLAKEDGGFVERTRFTVPFRTDQFEYQLNVFEPSGALLSAGYVGSASHIFRARADGGFETAFTYPNLSIQPRALAMADFGGEGTSELVVARGDGIGSNLGGDLLVLGNDGGTYVELDRTPSIPLNANTLALGDFDEDGKLDVVIGFYQRQQLMLLRGR